MLCNVTFGNTYTANISLTFVWKNIYKVSNIFINIQGINKMCTRA